MWKLYSQSGQGIAIQSTVNKLQVSLKYSGPIEIALGLVEYLDYDVAKFPSLSPFYPFVSKRKSFAHEQELRAIIWREDIWQALRDMPFLPVTMTIPESGVYVATDLEQLVEEIKHCARLTGMVCRTS
jgi:hypothetical protein